MIEYAKLSRRELKTLRAQRVIIVQRLGELAKRIKQLDDELDAAVQEHQKTTGPLQQRLQDIEDQAVHNMLAGSILDTRPDERSIQLRREVEDANAALEAKRDDVNRRKELLKADGDKLKENLPDPNMIATQLFRLGDKSKQAQHAGIQLAADALVGVLRNFQGKVSDLENAIAADDAASDLYKSRLPRHQTAVASLARIHDELRAQAEALRLEIIEAN